MIKIFRSYQKRMFKYCLTVVNPLLFVAMRLGKTLVIIRWLQSVIDIGNILIVVPYSALFGWEIELEDEDELHVFKLIGSKKQRLNILENCWSENEFGLNWFLINPEMTRLDYKLTEQEKKQRKFGRKLFVSQLAKVIARKDWAAIIYDECTYLRNHKTTITKYFMNSFPHVDIKAGLTGTPAPEGEHEYYCVCQCIEPNTFYESNYWKFEYYHFQILPNEKRWLKPKSRDYITKRLDKYSYFLSLEDVKLGGKIIREIRTLQMPAKTRKIYNKVEKEFVLELESKIIKTTIFATTKYIWLRRLCGGIIEESIIDKEKFKIILQLLKGELRNQQIIIWCHFIDEIISLQKLLEDKFKVTKIHGSVKPQEREVRRCKFQEGIYEVLICQPGCFKFGVDLSAAETMIYYSLPNSSLTYSQSESRTINISKKNSVLVLSLLCENTVDFDVYNGLIKKESKSKLIERIVKGMRGRQL